MTDSKPKFGYMVWDESEGDWTHKVFSTKKGAMSALKTALDGYGLDDDDDWIAGGLAGVKRVRLV